MAERDQDKIVERALEAVQQHEREAIARGEKLDSNVMMRRAMGYPSDLTSGSIGGSLIETVEHHFGPEAWTATVARAGSHPDIPVDRPGPSPGAVLLLIYAMELGREIGKRERG